MLGPQKWCFLDSEPNFPIVSALNASRVSEMRLQILLSEVMIIEFKLLIYEVNACSTHYIHICFIK